VQQDATIQDIWLFKAGHSIVRDRSATQSREYRQVDILHSGTSVAVSFGSGDPRKFDYKDFIQLESYNLLICNYMIFWYKLSELE
jgi:hypothetical protein